MNYSHTQKSKLFLFIFFIIIGLFYFVIINSNENELIFTSIIMLTVLFIIYSFISLTVTIDESFMRIKFGYGIYRKNFLLSEIKTISQVKNRWYYGWGIRVWFWPKMIIFNVSGFDAIEIVMNNGKIYRIGTDEPIELKNALHNSMQNISK